MSKTITFWTGCFLGQSFAYLCAGSWRSSAAALIVYLGICLFAGYTQETKA